MKLLARTVAGCRGFAPWALVVLLAAPGAAADEPGAAASAWVRTDHSAVRLISPQTGAGLGDAVPLGLHFRLRPGWKIYWRSPGDAGVPPRIDWSGSRNLAGAEIRWPLPERFTIFGLTTLVYGKEVVLPIDARIERPGEPLSLRADVSYLICEKLCIPYDARLALDLGPGPGQEVRANAQAIEHFARRVPPRLDGDAAAAAPLSVSQARMVETGDGLGLEVLARADHPFEDPDLLVEGPSALRFGRPEAELSKDKAMALFRVPVFVAGRGEAVPPERPLLTLTLADHGRAVEQAVPAVMTEGAAGLGTELVLILGLALLGGLILNLMPCVLPVLSIKVLSVVGHGGAEAGAVRRGFLATATGIVFSFLVLAAGAIAMKAAGTAVGWGIQFQEPLFLTAMAAVLTLFAANLFGLFEIPLPGFAGEATRVGGRKSLGGAFATGAFATLLATPCSAPFLGTAIGFALSRGTGEILAVFTALGLGLAAPYLAVAAWPGLATALPRPGRWMVVLRRTLGVVLILTAVWLLSVLWPLAGLGAALAVGLLLAGALGALALRRLGSISRRAAGALAGVLIAATLVVPATFGGGGAPAPAEEGPVAGIPWQPFDKVELLNHVAEGRVVLVDVTADWCLTCKANEALVLERGEVVARLRSGDVIAMRADWTRPDPAISAYLRSFGRYGVPFNAVYGPGAPSGIVLGELLSQGQVLDALAAASEISTAKGR